jgi:CRISPR/Cas system-associated endonuclease Cas3-HD
MKALQLLKELQNGVIPFDEEISKAIQELEILEIEVIELREANKDFLDTIIASRETILKVISK